MTIRKLMRSIMLAAMIVIYTSGTFAANSVDDGNIYVWRNGSIVYMNQSATVDQVAYEDNKTIVTLYSADKDVLFTTDASAVDSITFKYYAPAADLLDIKFNADGTVVDASPMQNTVEIIAPDDIIPTYYNKTYGCYVGRFENDSWGTGSLGTKPVYCKVDYADNEDFMNGLAGGHTLETIFRAFYTEPIEDAEAKWFASHEAGGTGLMVCKKANGLNGENEMTFLPNVSTDGSSSWKWATSGVVPQSEVYYHVVGVWNQEEGKAYVYVNGELMNTVDAQGDLHFATNTAARWFGIGCDAGPTDGQFGGDWEIVTAKVYSYPLSSYDVSMMYNEISDSSTAPVADVLDGVFNSDGTADDVSPMHNEITSVTGDALTVYYNDLYTRNVAKFDNSWASTTTGYYSVDYANNEAFKSALADGHTLEAVVMANYVGTIPNGEAKFFASHESGGTGLMVCNTSNGLNGGNDLSFLPNVSTNGSSSWKWAVSGVVPESGVYYHVVGVWNKEEGKAYIYVNGELKNTVAAEGDYHFQTDSNMWFAIGCDAGPTAQLGWNGDVVLARIYDEPLTQRQVELLWNEVETEQENIEKMVSDVDFYSGIAVKEGTKYEIDGNGFVEGDMIQLTSIDGTYSVTLSCELNGDNSIFVEIPVGLTSGKYMLTLVRGENIQNLGITSFVVVEQIPAGAEVIAHRGYWTGNAQNSRESLQKAQELGVYGSETDVWLTTDGHLLINHDSSYNGVVIKDATSETCKNLVLDNGENMPELGDFLEMIMTDESPTKLIIEIKDHGTTALNQAAASATVNAVEEYGAQDKVEYISFSSAACEQIIKDDPDAKVAYLSGDMSPSELYSRGYTGIDYQLDVLLSNQEYISEAHELGMTVNAWTVSTVANIAEMTNLGVDYITTDTPVDALNVKSYYDNNQ